MLLLGMILPAVQAHGDAWVKVSRDREHNRCLTNNMQGFQGMIYCYCYHIVIFREYLLQGDLVEQTVAGDELAGRACTRSSREGGKALLGGQMGGCPAVQVGCGSPPLFDIRPAAFCMNDT